MEMKSPNIKIRQCYIAYNERGGLHRYRFVFAEKSTQEVIDKTEPDRTRSNALRPGCLPDPIKLYLIFLHSTNPYRIQRSV